MKRPQDYRTNNTLTVQDEPRQHYFGLGQHSGVHPVAKPEWELLTGCFLWAPQHSAQPSCNPWGHRAPGPAVLSLCSTVLPLPWG